jgi:CheY-like chemotaxis protein
VVTAADGREALSVLANEEAAGFDAVILDVQMPVMDGMETVRAIRDGMEPGVDPDMPVVGLTGHVMDRDRQLFLAAGMDDCLAKPVETEKLIQAVNRAIRARGRDQDL